MKKLVYLIIVIPMLFAFKGKPKTNKNLPKGYVYVPSGYVYTNLEAVLLNSEATEIIKDSCNDFYISSLEVSNLEYKEFLNDLKQEGKLDEYHKYYPDTSAWLDVVKLGKAFVSYYFQHPAYNDYPLVGITLEQANAYCSWLTCKYQPKSKGVKVVFSVPTKIQWIRAARGDSQFAYAQGGKYLRNSKGLYLYNFKTTSGESIHFDEQKKTYKVVNTTHKTDGGFITTPTGSYWPNQFGLYQVCGNVAELVSDSNVAMGGSWNDTGYDIRVESEKFAQKASCLIGFRIMAQISE